MTPSSKQIISDVASSQSVPVRQGGLRKERIDPTHLVISDAPVGRQTAFSFLVMGDTDTGASDFSDTDFSDTDFSMQFAQQVKAHLAKNRFLLHTGDIVYPTGSYENYFKHFLQPYQTLLTHLPKSAFYRSDEIVFNRPFLPVPGNHDYSYPRGRFDGMKWLLRAVCDRLRQTLNIDLGHYGGEGGEAYSQTFLDALATLSSKQLSAHLREHYGARVENGLAAAQYCLDYRPHQFTRLPNRYYSFQYGGIDFFALDSNTWKTSPAAPGFDQAQLDWLTRKLIDSWRNPNSIGRIVYLHHSPYTTEASHWQQSETLWVRKNLRTVLDRVAQTLQSEATLCGDEMSDRTTAKTSVPLVDLVLSGHAHCLEHLKTTDTGHGDADIDWVVCGGSGASLRRQKTGDSNILENMRHQGRQQTKVVAKSQLYAGRHGRRSKEQTFHSFIRIDVQPHQAQKITVCPFLVTCDRGQWQTKAIAPLSVGQAVSPSYKTAHF